MTFGDGRVNAPKYVALAGDAAQIVAALTIDGAVLDARMVVQDATPGFASRFGAGSPVGQSLYDLLVDAEARALLAAFVQAQQSPAGPAPTGMAEGAPGPVPADPDGPEGEAPADTAGSVDVLLARPRMLVRVSVLTPVGAAPPGFLARELPGSVLSNRPEDNVHRIASHSRGRAYQILSQMSHAYWENDLVSGAFLGSEGWRTMRGVPTDQPVAAYFSDWKERIHPEDWPALSVYLRRLRKGEADFVPVIYRERHDNGHWMTILCNGAAIEWDDEGQPTRIAGTDADITASHSTEEYTRQIAQLEQRWLIAAEYGQLGLWDHDEEAGTRYLSQTWRTMRGYDPDDIFDDSLESLIERTHPDDRSALLAQIEATTNGSTDIVQQEYRERHRDGHWISILSRGRVIGRDAAGRPLRIIGIDTDITEIKASSERVHRMSRRLELAFATTQVGVWDHDFARNKTVWDARMIEIFGLDLPAGQVPQGTWENAIHPEDRDRVLADTDSLASGETAFADEYRIVRPDGTIRHIRSRTTRIFNDEGGHGLIGVNWDVTADVAAADELRRAHALASQRNEELERAREEMEYNALHDALTDLPNRRYLDQRMRAPFGPDQRIAVMQLDLDRFKQINDTLGHAAGDTVLRHVASVLNTLVPRTATVARVGGDEFVIYFDTAPRRDVLERIAEMIVAELRQPVAVNGQDCRLGASVGVALGVLPDQTPDEVFENADMALYEAKSSGRGRFVFFADRMRIAVETKRLLADAILGGLDRDEFYCVYQPQFEAGTLRLSGIEALVRWRRPDGTVELPSVFLGVAEELGVVDRIDQRVLDHVLTDQARWSQLGLPVPRVSVNISARRLADPHLPLRLDKLAIASGKIAFELLETVFLDTPDPVIAANIAAIRKLGIQIEIDDFGTGHASIVGMLQLQPDRLKIDRQLIGPLLQGEKQRILVRSIIDIGRMHGIDLIAEGVETADHVRLLTRMGCHFLQGFGLAVPMPEAELRARLQSGRWEFTAVA
jgi:diguanylate cyclase (GGDEF)-like protein/PAS domain S-box-containing protein